MNVYTPEHDQRSHTMSSVPRIVPRTIPALAPPLRQDPRIITAGVENLGSSSFAPPHTEPNCLNLTLPALDMDIVIGGNGTSLVQSLPPCSCSTSLLPATVGTLAGQVGVRLARIGQRRDQDINVRLPHDVVGLHGYDHV